ncbi:hypothetical protein J3A84_14635 [Proteiniclasticum sp. SCR006]|uniref:Uncharacterized protein n=1 Tax=Proteiniclasticum aestuarii TaxID=2817862 RepID=A0A939HAN0_9CLOT|nr:hypothetical protein [Proteiniclasticum aestuarii]MBO1266271.1 hypothetical protein [Proteiniclasticum aestuarii]
MKSRVPYLIALGSMVAALLVLGMNTFLAALSDAMVRTAGIIMMADLVYLSYFTAKHKKKSVLSSTRNEEV